MNSVLKVLSVANLVEQGVSNSDFITDGTLVEQSSEEEDDVQLPSLT